MTNSSSICWRGKRRDQERPPYEHYSLEHVLSFQRRVKAVKQYFFTRGATTPLGICQDFWDRTDRRRNKNSPSSLPSRPPSFNGDFIGRSCTHALPTSSNIEITGEDSGPRIRKFLLRLRKLRCVGPYTCTVLSGSCAALRTRIEKRLPRSPGLLRALGHDNDLALRL